MVALRVQRWNRRLAPGAPTGHEAVRQRLHCILSVMFSPRRAGTRAILASVAPMAETATREATLRAVVMGVVFGALFGAANAYLGLRVGFTIATSIPVAVMTV